MAFSAELKERGREKMGKEDVCYSTLVQSAQAAHKKKGEKKKKR